jgi:tRNA-(ms[2]io[6]A)-hydroxylase
LNDAARFSHALLRVPTPAAWLAEACAHPELLLIDHANCEKKAASTALALMFAYAEDLHLAGKMSKLIQTMKMVPQRLAPGRYAERLRRLVARSEPQREMDLMICGAFIESRSCERFAALAPVIAAPMAGLFRDLHAAEARHFKVYLELAKRAAERADLEWQTRLDAFAALESELITAPDPVFRFHSGPPTAG